ncbi:OmpA family protein [Veronia pacifica]|uniref:OmpA-like domain-containing protein n=1 Tax=Veronia pacifica TaxID=1080227 RepID=A0A1C3ED86_9GAMM|nr:OmpA family protein [Veronia pacifica]ODA31198.1 hypothetical protein A8L45_17710 [Veronia pacifica]
MKKSIISMSLALAMSPLYVSADSEGFYFGPRVGMSMLNDACASGSECEDKKVGAGLLLGYGFDDRLSVEGSYDLLGKFKTSFDEENGNRVLSNGKLSALTLAPKLDFPIDEVSDIYGKIGISRWNWDSKDAKQEGTSLLAALGYDRQLTDLINLRLEYQLMRDLTDNYFRGVDAHFVNLGMTLHLGRTSAQPPAPEPVVVAPIKKPEPPKKPVVQAPKRLVLTSASGVEMFKTGQSSLSKNAQNELLPLLRRLTKFEQATISVTGYTDSVGAAAFNQKLSEKRAQTVADYFTSRGIDPSRITVSGKGEANPVASNDTADGRAKNRRVEITSPEFSYEVPAN